MKAIKLFSMAAVALLMAACSNDEIEQAQQPEKARGVIEFTGTISAGSTTRTTITEGTGDDADKLLVAWSEGDELHLFQGTTEYGTATISDVDDETGEATIQGSLQFDGYDLDQPFTIKYFGSATSEEELEAALLDQTGMILDLWNYDWREGSGKLVVDDNIGKYVLSTKVTMESQIAIWKISLTDDAIEPEPLGATKLTLRLGSQVIAGTAAVEAASDEFYLCVVPATLTALYDAATEAEQPTPDFTIEATVDGQTYTYKKAGALSLETNYYYQSTVAISSSVDIGLFVGGESSGTKLLWAKMNVGAETETDAGLYFAWGDVTGRSGVVSLGYTAADGYSFNWVNYTYANGNQNKLTKYCNNSEYGNDGFTDELTTLESGDDAATANWGGSWRMPTYAELNALLATKNDTENYSWEWKTNYNGSGKRGYLITYTVNGNSIFLPATGYRQLTDVYPAMSGYYWSSTFYSDNPSLAWNINFRNNEASMGNDFPRFSGFTIRPVKAGN